MPYAPFRRLPVVSSDPSRRLRPLLSRLRWMRRSCLLGLQKLWAYCPQLRNAHCCPPPAGCADHAYCVCKIFGLIGLNCVTPDGVHRRSESDRLAVNGKHRFVTGVSRNFFHVLVVISERHGKTVHFDAESLLQQLLGADYFILHPLLVLGPGEFGPRFLSARAGERDGMPFAQVLMRRGVRLDIHPVIAHIGELFPCDRSSSA